MKTEKRPPKQSQFKYQSIFKMPLIWYQKEVKMANKSDNQIPVFEKIPDEPQIRIPAYRYEIFHEMYSQVKVLKRFCETEPSTSIRISDIARIFNWQLGGGNND